MKRCSTKSIQSLPPEILLAIFEYLNPKELAYCSLVSKQWHSLTSSDKIWKKIFRKYHINLPFKSDISIKKEYLKRSKDFLNVFLSDHIKSRRLHHLFPSFEEIRKLELSVQGEIFDNKKNSLLKHGQRILPITFNFSPNMSAYINYQSKIDKRLFPDLKTIDSFDVKLIVPALIKKLIPTKETIRIHLRMCDLLLSKKIKSILNQQCQCNKLFIHANSKKSETLIEWHICVIKFLIGIWSSDKSVAYFSFHISMLDIQSILEKFLYNNSSKNSDFPVLVKAKDIQESRFTLTKSENDLKCMLSIENIEPSKSLLVNCWRSVDYFKDLPINLIEKSDSNSHLKFDDNIEFKPSIGHFQMKYENIMKIQIDMVTSRNDPLWSHLSCVTLIPTSINNVDYNYAKTELMFNDSIIKGTMIYNECENLCLTELIIL